MGTLIRMTWGTMAAALLLATGCAGADGAPGKAELRVLELLQSTFGLADDDVKKLTAEA